MKMQFKEISKRFLLLVLLLVIYSIVVAGRQEYSKYLETVNQWTSYHDVATWMRNNYAFDSDKSDYVKRRIKKLKKQFGVKKAWNQPGMLQSPEETFERKKGFCGDAANFARDAINRINPEFNAKMVFIKNKMGQPHHWVTGFTINGKVFIMDYGAGPYWSAMNGVHGPYNTLHEYVDFLSSLNIRLFVPVSAKWTVVQKD